MGSKDKQPQWIDAKGRRVRYDEIIVDTGQPYYGGGTVPKRTKRRLLFPEATDEAERGFGVDNDFFVP